MVKPLIVSLAGAELSLNSNLVLWNFYKRGLKWELVHCVEFYKLAEYHLSELLLAGELKTGQSLKVGVKGLENLSSALLLFEASGIDKVF